MIGGQNDMGHGKIVYIKRLQGGQNDMGAK